MDKSREFTRHYKEVKTEHKVVNNALLTINDPWWLIEHSQAHSSLLSPGARIVADQDYSRNFTSGIWLVYEYNSDVNFRQFTPHKMPYVKEIRQ